MLKGVGLIGGESWDSSSDMLLMADWSSASTLRLDFDLRLEGAIGGMSKREGGGWKGMRPVRVSYGVVEGTE